MGSKRLNDLTQFLPALHTCPQKSCRGEPRATGLIGCAGLRAPPALPYKRPMAETTYFPRRLILAGAMISGVLLALAVHMMGVRYGLDLGGLWRSGQANSCRRARRSRGG